MITFIKMIPLEVEDMEIMEPTEDMSPGEIVVGEMPECCRKLYTYGNHIAERYARLQIELHMGRVDRDKAMSELEELESKAKLIGHMMWVGIKDELNLWEGKHNVDYGVRKGYVVVRFKSKPQMLGLNLGDLLGD